MLLYGRAGLRLHDLVGVGERVCAVSLPVSAFTTVHGRAPVELHDYRGSFARGRLPVCRCASDGFCLRQRAIGGLAWLMADGGVAAAPTSAHLSTGGLQVGGSETQAALALQGSGHLVTLSPKRCSFSLSSSTLLVIEHSSCHLDLVWNRALKQRPADPQPRSVAL